MAEHGYHKLPFLIALTDQLLQYLTRRDTKGCCLPSNTEGELLDFVIIKDLISSLFFVKMIRSLFFHMIDKIRVGKTGELYGA